MPDADKPLEERVSSLEREVARLSERVLASDARLAEAAQDAEAARILASGADHDVSEVRAELRAHTLAINALRQDHVELRGEVVSGFAQVHTRFDAVDGQRADLAAGQEQIVGLLNVLIRRERGETEDG
ncbi:MAG: hypothetical protein ACT4QF_19025 [Sporichthyaceae bacterium]|jgi:chromosome segregation ATPase